MSVERATVCVDCDDQGNTYKPVWVWAVQMASDEERERCIERDPAMIQRHADAAYGACHTCGRGLDE